jgi:beta-lactamase regulating signal transducer with metallopeptidase domain
MLINIYSGPFNEYSLIMAVLVFNLAMIVVAMMRRRTGYLAKYSTLALVLLALFGALRITLPIGFPFTHVINSFNVFPRIESVLMTRVWPGAELWAVMLLIWGGGALVMLLRIARQMFKEHMYRQRYRIAEGDQANRIVQELQLKNIKIIVSPDVVVPYVIGFFQAKIYLPHIEMTDDALIQILKHEYQHFKSRDILIKTFYSLLSIVFWWNPIVHVFMRELDHLLEMRCDEALTKRMDEDDKTRYMESLLFIAKYIQAKNTARPAGVSAFVRVEQYGFMEQRFHLIQSGGNIKSVGKQIASVALVVMVFIASFMVVVQPARYPSELDTEEIFRITAENAYILITKDGRYEMHIEGQPTVDLGELPTFDRKETFDLLNYLYNNLPIIEED